MLFIRTRTFQNLHDMKRFVVIIFLILCAVQGRTQTAEPAHVVMVGTQDLYLCDVFPPTHVETLDTARLTITYQVTYRKDLENDSRQKDVWTFQLGDHYVKTYSYSLFRADSLSATSLDHTLISTEERPLDMVFKHRASSVIREYQRLPFFQRQSLYYEESAPKIMWRISNDSCTVLGYRCRKAEAYFGGRTWSVWFAEEIPISEGPWKLSGLPGAVLRAYDASDSYRIEAETISSSTHPIIFYDCNGRELSKNRWKKHISLNHSAPYSSVSQGGIIAYYTFGSQTPLGVEWIIPYNPLELK